MHPDEQQIYRAIERFAAPLIALAFNISFKIIMQDIILRKIVFIILCEFVAGCVINIFMRKLRKNVTDCESLLLTVSVLSLGGIVASLEQLISLILIIIRADMDELNCVLDTVSIIPVYITWICCMLRKINYRRLFKDFYVKKNN